MPSNEEEYCLSDMATWILRVCYQKVVPSQQELEEVKEELRRIYAYEGLPIKHIIALPKNLGDKSLFSIALAPRNCKGPQKRCKNHILN